MLQHIFKRLYAMIVIAGCVMWCVMMMGIVWFIPVWFIYNMMKY